MGWRPKDYEALMEAAHRAATCGLELNPQESECHRILAQIAMLRGDPDKAVSFSERALSLNPNDDRCVCGMGEILVFAGRHEEAEGFVRKAMRLNPYHPERYWYHLGRSLYHQGSHSAAWEALREVTRPRIRDLAYRAASASLAGKTEDASQAVETLLEAKPEFDSRAFAESLSFTNPQDQAALERGLTACNGLD